MNTWEIVYWAFLIFIQIRTVKRAGRLPIAPASTVHRRIDLIYTKDELGILHTAVLTGVPAAAPIPPTPPTGCRPIATVYMAPLQDTVRAGHITEARSVSVADGGNRNARRRKP